MCDSVGNDFDSEALSIADRFITSPPVTHHTRKLEGISDPATVFLPIQINRQVHSFIISCRTPFGAPRLSLRQIRNLRGHPGPQLQFSAAANAFTGTDRGLLRSVLGPWSPVPKCEAPGSTHFSGRTHFHGT